jgi:F-type H+-transporting ATPase subunit delta
VRESIRGYLDAVMETAASDGNGAVIAGELAGLGSVVRASEDLRAALSDPGLLARVRRSVVTDLLKDRADSATVALVGFTVDNDRAPEIVADLDWLAAAAADSVAGRVRAESDILGRSASRERIDGYSTGVLQPLDRTSELGPVTDELFRFARLVAASPELTGFLTDREMPAERRSGVVRDLLTGKAAVPAVRLAAYASRFGRPRDYLATLNWLVERVAAEADRRVAEVRSAVELDDDQRHRLSQALARITGRDVEVRVSVESDLLGGFVASVGDTVVDGSARHRLELLKERLSLPHLDLLTRTVEAS